MASVARSGRTHTLSLCGSCCLLIPRWVPSARITKQFSAGFRHFHKWKYKWWSIRDDFLKHFLKSLTMGVTSSWITLGTFHDAKSSRCDYRALFNGTETNRWRFSLRGGAPPSLACGAPPALKWGSRAGCSALLIPYSGSTVGLRNGNVRWHLKDAPMDWLTGGWPHHITVHFPYITHDSESSFFSSVKYGGLIMLPLFPPQDHHQCLLWFFLQAYYMTSTVSVAKKITSLRFIWNI